MSNRTRSKSGQFAPKEAPSDGFGPGEDSTAAADAAADAADRAAFDKIAQSAKSQPKAEVHEADYWLSTERADEAASTPSDDVFDELGKEAERRQAGDAPKAEAEPATNDQSSSERTEGYDRAVSALLLDGWSMKDINDLSEDAVLRVGQKRQRNQADVSAKLQERAEKAKSIESEAKPEPRDEGPTVEAELDKLLTDEVVSDPGKLRTALKEVFKKFQGETADIKQQVQAKLAAQERESAARVQSQLDQARRELIGTIPDLADDSIHQGLIEDMRELARVPSVRARYQGMDPGEGVKSLMQEAARIAGLKVNGSATNGVSASAPSVRDHSSPTAPTRKSAPAQMSEAETDRAVFDRIADKYR